MNIFRIPPRLQTILSKQKIKVLPKYLGGDFLGNEGIIPVEGPYGKCIGNILVDPSLNKPYQVINYNSIALDGHYIEATITAAFEYRKTLQNNGELEISHDSAFRLINQIQDGLPGLAIDIYGSYALILLFSRHWDYYIDDIQKALLRNTTFPITGVYLSSHVRGHKKQSEEERMPRDSLFYTNKHMTPIIPDPTKEDGFNPKPVTTQAPGGVCIGGRKAPGHRVIITDNGIKYEVKLDNGSITGLYLNQSNQRKKLRGFLENVETQRYLKLKNKKINNPNFKSKEVIKTFLNLFSFTCSFGLIAAKASYESTNVDISPTSLQIGRKNYFTNKIEPNSHIFWEKEVFRGLHSLNSQDKIYDVVLLDPPQTFKIRQDGRVGIPNQGAEIEKKLHRMGYFHYSTAENYSTLVNYAASLVAPGGYLITFANSQSLNQEEFEQKIKEGFNSMLARRKKEIELDRSVAQRKRLRIQEVKKKVRERVVDQTNFEPTDEEMSTLYNFQLVEEWPLSKDFEGHQYTLEGNDNLTPLIWKRIELKERTKEIKRSERKQKQAAKVDNLIELLPKVIKQNQPVLKSDSKPYI